MRIQTNLYYLDVLDYYYLDSIQDIDTILNCFGNTQEKLRISNI